MNDPSVTRTVRLPLSLNQRIEELAQKRGWSVNAWIVRALTNDAQPKKDTVPTHNAHVAPRGGE